MKSINLILAVLATAFMMSSCSDDHDDHADCHECHLSLPMSDGSEMMWNITNSAGGEDFCGDELADAEGPSYVYTVTDTLTCTMGTHTIPPGEYGPGSTDNSQYEIHCEDHGNHDH